MVYTDAAAQLVYMCLLPGETVPLEKHARASQIITVAQGTATVSHMHGTGIALHANETIIVPPNQYRRIENASARDALYLYTLYAPPQHEEPRRRQRERK